MVPAPSPGPGDRAARKDLFSVRPNSKHARLDVDDLQTANLNLAVLELGTWPQWKGRLTPKPFLAVSGGEHSLVGEMSSFSTAQTFEHP